MSLLALMPLASMPLFVLFLLVAAIGFGAYALVTYISMPSEIKKLIIVLAIAVCLGIVLQACGVLDYVRGVQVPHV